MRILGLSAFGGESAAALVVDGRVVAAQAEERFTRTRRDPSFPRRAARSCLRLGGVQAADLDWVVFHEKPLRKFERVLVSQLRGFPASAGPFARSLFVWLGDRLWMRGRIAGELGVPPERVIFTEHHEAHAASAYLPSPFEEAAVLVADGSGEWATTSLWRGTGARLEKLDEIDFPHSLGLFASAMTEHLGFAPGGGEARLMELAAHGEPRHVEALRSLLRVEGVPGAGGAFSVDMSAFRFGFDGERLCGPELAARIGVARAAGEPLRWSGEDRRHADFAASVQQVLEEALLALLAELHRRAPSENLCLAGELALNPRAVARMLRDGPFRRVWVQPAAGDGGCALGAALAAHHALAAPGALAEAGAGAPRWRQEHAFLGEEPGDPPEAGPAQGAAKGVAERALAGDEEIVETLLAHLLRDGMAGWVRGRFEWGPRSLGHRSLLADPRRVEAREAVSAAAKRREGFRPYAPAVPAERAAEYFELPPGAEGPLRFMQIEVRAREAARRAAPAAVHADGTSRPQLVDRAADPLFHRLLTRFGEATGAPILLQTSLNLRGDPLVRGAEDAVALFQRSGLPALVVERLALERG